MRFEHIDDKKVGKFVLYDEVEIGFISYYWESPIKIVVDHTFVKDEFRGKGYGKKLSEIVEKYVSDNNLEYSATCSFIRK